MIAKQISRSASKINAVAVIDQQLLDEVTGLVEWPITFVGDFDSRFLRLPKEVLISTMNHHQKYFHLTDEKNKLLSKFVCVSNIKSKSPKRVRLGNERVLRARLADAEFFWESDQKNKLNENVESLKNVLFHNKLGSIYDKTSRIENLALLIGSELDVDERQIKSAARLCKADLVTNLVGEFPELQGTIGKYYAKNQGEDKLVADAIGDHYKPRFSGDKLPTSSLTQCIALADRIDTLVGIFACNEIPTGDKDPFALRRAALGVLRILIEGKLNLDLYDLLASGMKNYAASNLDNINTNSEVVDQIYEFISERLKGYFQSKGYSLPEVLSVQSCKPTVPFDFYQRLKAVNHFFSKRKEAAESLASSNKRIANILTKANIEISHSNGLIDESLLESKTGEAAEVELIECINTVSKEVRSHFSAGRYDMGFEMLSKMKTPVDKFFDEVMVMHEDKSIRENRLALLSEIRKLFLGAADISRMQVE